MTEIKSCDAGYLNAGQSADEIMEKNKQEYMDMWVSISRLSPEDSEKIMNGIQQQVILTTVKRKTISDFIQYLKSPTPYVAMAIGGLLPILFAVFFLWYSLLLE